MKYIEYVRCAQTKENSDINRLEIIQFLLDRLTTMRVWNILLCSLFLGNEFVFSKIGATSHTIQHYL